MDLISQKAEWPDEPTIKTHGNFCGECEANIRQFTSVITQNVMGKAVELTAAGPFLVELYELQNVYKASLWYRHGDIRNEATAEDYEKLETLDFEEMPDIVALVHAAQEAVQWEI
jgi:hypothetical protein